MNTLLVYPAYPDTFWSFRHALRFIRREAVYPPLGLITVAAMLPREWSQRLVDLNVRGLTREDLDWADLVMVSAMEIQQESVEDVLAACSAARVPVVAGGPLFTASPERFTGRAHLVLGEAEVSLAPFLEDLHGARGEDYLLTPRIYRARTFADLADTPIPRWDLVTMEHYGSMNLQYSRGCPYDCEFCDITALFGHRPRTKTTERVLAELEEIWRFGWRGSVFFVDDNFIGKRSHLKKNLLPSLAAWNEARHHPFNYNTEASINLADDDVLVDEMVAADFDTVFVGIETPSKESLEECNKLLNSTRDLMGSVRHLQRRGLQVQGGFILGFDSDTSGIFDRQIRFIQKSGIVTAMVGLLNAPRLSRLHKRLTAEDRILEEWSGNNTDFSTNIIPKLPREELIEGYRRVIRGLYSHSAYYKRVRQFLREYRPRGKRRWRLRKGELGAFLRSIWALGIRQKGRRHYWGLLFWTALRRPRMIHLAVTFTIYGHHFRTVFGPQM